MPELVSILIPAYNAGDWIGDTIRSALDQTWRNKEIIVVNDGSTDNTLQIAKQFECASLRVINQANKGASAARNNALKHARGDYIQWLDADDILDPGKIERQLMGLADLESQNKRRILLSGPFGKFYYRYSRAKFSSSPCWRDLYPMDWLLLKFNKNAWLNPACWLVSRELTDIAGPWDERLSWDDDGEYFIRVVLASEKVQFVPDARVYYRVCNIGSYSRTFSQKALDSVYLSAELSVNHVLRAEDSKRTREAALVNLQRRFALFYPHEKILMEKLQKLAWNLGGSLPEPQQSWKFSLARKILGWRKASRLKTAVWKFSVLTHRNLDWFLSVLFGPGINSIT